jgi:hypothetical protein
MKNKFVSSGKLAGGLSLLLAIGLVAAIAGPAMAQPPPIPEDHQFGGQALICETPVDPGAGITAKIAGSVVEWTTTVDDTGWYGRSEMVGGTGLFFVPADDPDTPEKDGGVDGDEVEFEIDGQDARTLIGGVEQTVIFEGGAFTQVDLQLVVDVELTVLVDPPECGTATGAGTYACSDDAPIEAFPNVCCNFIGWTGDGIDDPGALATTVYMDGNKTVTANFEKIEYTLTVASGIGGSVTTPGEGDFPYDCCTDVNLVAEAETGYIFGHWDGDVADPDSATTTVHIDGDKTVTANFEEYVGPTCELTVVANPPTCGTVTGSGTYPCDSTVPITATVTDVCCEFVNWAGAGITDPGLPNTTVLVDADKTVVANFDTIEYTLTVASGAGGSVTTPGEGDFPYDCCTTVDLVAEADPDYKFTHWDGDVADPNLATTTVHIDGDKTVTANFVLDVTYDLTLDSTDGGSVTVPGEGTFEYDAVTVVNLLAVPEAGQRFCSWTGDVDTVADVYDASTTVTMNGDYHVTAVFGMHLMDVDLGVDWNTFSTPIYLHPCVNTWGELAAAGGILQETGEIAYRYNSSTNSWDLVLANDPVPPLCGYYVYLLSAGTVPIMPTAEPLGLPFMELDAGLNLLGPALAAPALADMDVASNFISIYEAPGGLIGYTQIVSPTINTPNDWTYVRDGTLDTKVTKAGEAYWAVLENADILWGFCTTPVP